MANLIPIPDSVKYASVGPGWMRIVEELHRQLATIDPDYTIDQIKEKFGGLRYYYTPSWYPAEYPVEDTVVYAAKHSTMESLVALAERICARTCETCGGSGKSRNSGGWFATLCDGCSSRRYQEPLSGGDLSDSTPDRGD